METETLSKKAQKRLRKQGSILPSSTNATEKSQEESPNIVHSSTSAKKKKKKSAKKKAKSQIKMEQKPESASVAEDKSHSKPTVTPPTGKRKRKHDPKQRVGYINSNYVSNDANDVGGLIQAEMVGLRKQSTNIRSASDLTENQAHVIKRQITKLQGAQLERNFKRPKHCQKTLGEATKELARLLEIQRAKLAKNK